MTTLHLIRLHAGACSRAQLLADARPEPCGCALELIRWVGHLIKDISRAIAPCVEHLGVVDGHRGAWIALCGPSSVAPLQAIATAVDPRLRVRVTGNDDDWIAEFDRSDTALPESPEVQVTKFSLGATFEFQPRRSLPLTPV